MDNDTLNKSKEKLKSIINDNIERDGIWDLYKYIEEDTDFFTAPSSSKYHNNVEGGLFQHSLNVLYYALMLHKFSLKNSSVYEKYQPNKESIYIVSLFHDLCKVNFYSFQQHWKKNTEGRWESYLTYVVDEQPPYLDHANKSVFLLQQYIRLSEREAEAIRWHMGAFDPSAHFAYPYGFAFRNAMEKNSLVPLINSADISASMIENIYDYKENTFIK